MTTVEALSTPGATEQTEQQSIQRFVPSKISAEHLERLAIVYVRQSSPQQVEEHKESLARQYALKNHASAYGWRPERILVIDEDLGLSGRRADNRQGFQRLLTEVTMEHVGMVLGIEMSRLARSNKDWHHLLELCGVFGSLLADEDGVYDPNDSNDRLLLGLKGTISEFELVTMRNRLERGKLNKAMRGELFLHAPVGFVKGDDGNLRLDPDEQVRGVVHLIFDRFAELGSIHATFRYLLAHDIQIGVRPIAGPERGAVVWRMPQLGTVASILRNPTYAGAYTYGRFPVDRKRQRAGGSKRAIRFAPMEEWQVILRDKFPGYITWERYLENRERARQNRTTLTTRGSARGGGALLAGILYCAKCGGRMIVRYSKAHQPRYECQRNVLLAKPGTCCGLNAAALDSLVEREVLRAVEPGGIDLSIRALSDLQQERDRLNRHWQQSLERARYESQKAQRAYRAVDPENRLVARTLEQQWESALRQERGVIEDYERFQCELPRVLTTRETELIRSLAANVPAVWNAPTTKASDKQEVIRCLVERVSVNALHSENVEATISWVGGDATRHAIQRPVLKYSQLENFSQMRDSIAAWKAQGWTNAQIAERLNKDGFHSPAARAKRFTRGLVAQLVCRLGLAAPRDGRGILTKNEWWLRELAEELHMGTSRVRDWIHKGYLHSRKLGGGQYVVWADQAELVRLAQLRDWPRQATTLPEHLTHPTPRDRAAGVEDQEDQDMNGAGRKRRRSPK